MLTLEESEHLKEILERARQGSALALATIAHIKQKAREDEPDYIELMAELRRLVIDVCVHDLSGEWCKNAHFIRGVLQGAHRRCIKCGEYVNVVSNAVGE